MRRITKMILFLLVLICFWVFHIWFSPSALVAHDLPYIHSSMSSSYSVIPYIWHIERNVGLGGNAATLLWSYSFFSLPIALLGSILHLSWPITERVAFFYPFLVLSLTSSFLLSKKVFQDSLPAVLSAFLFTCNTYVLILVGGGQIEIGFAYAFVPFVLLACIALFESFQSNQKNIYCIMISLLFGFLVGLQLFFDLRVAYITIAGMILLLSIVEGGVLREQMIKKNAKWRSIGRFLLAYCIMPGILVILLNAFWLLPSVFSHSNITSDLGISTSTKETVSYFSFAKFENSISLLHPNWPENIFGKVGFMKPEFLLLPILAFASLLFINSPITDDELRAKKNKSNSQLAIRNSPTRKYILYFALLGLLGAFLAKGANDPFGGIYLWMFDHVPGFILFRDPTKWYTLVAVSYAVLIPFSISKIYEWLQSFPKFQINTKNGIFNLQNCFLFLVFCSLLYLIRPALLGQLTGTFKPTTVPSDYQKLEQFLSSQNQFSRTLWVPTTQRFVYSSSLHPAISSRDYFNAYDNTKLLNVLSQAKTQKFLQEAGVKYIIVPYDSEKEVFLRDRQYDNTQYQNVLNRVTALPGLQRVQGFGQIGVFELPSPKNHFWSPDGITVSSVQINPTKYQIHAQNALRGERVVFAESFDPRWVMTNANSRVESSEFDGKFNSFVLPKEGNYTFDVTYTPQKWVNIGLLISLLTGVSLLVLGGYLYAKNKVSIKRKSV